MQAEGLTAKASSIHVNGWFGGYDKLSTTRLMLREEFAIDVDLSRESWVFAGDSPNDQPMFAFFPHSVGVANVREMAELMRGLPAWVALSPGARGFAEIADSLLSAR
jgi:hydroxymethylpyrimidine pyrophosphatase-like HAD family hydrolase